MIRFILYLIAFLSGIYFSGAQQITGRIIDSQTKESIPFATIRVGETDLISNQEGYFTLSGENTNEATLLSVSFIGYAPQKISVSHLKSNNNIVELDLATYDIEGVYVSNIKPDPNEIMKLVNENLSQNYNNRNTKNYFFLRKTEGFRPKNIQVEIDKSTGFTKKQLKESNQEIKSLIETFKKYPPIEFSDVLGDLYISSEGKSKFDAKKATRLFDANRSYSKEKLEEKAKDIFLKHLDTTKNYKISSGWFTLSSKKKEQKRQEKNSKIISETKTDTTKVKTNSYSGISSEIIHTLNKHNFNHKNSFDFVRQTDLYEYTYMEATYLDRHLVYVLNFKPKKSKAKYEGTLYISDADYAIIRADYKYAKGKRGEGINLKLVLGVKFFQDKTQGIVVYKKNDANPYYYPHYISYEEGSSIYVHRPLKFKEEVKGKKDILKLDAIIDGVVIEKIELLNLQNTPITQEDFNTANTTKLNYIEIKQYDPNIWKDYNIIEPLEEMKKFKVLEE